MKTTLVSILLALGLSIHAASAGNSAKVGYASDFFYRGSQKAEDSVQSSLMLSHAVAGLNASAHVCSNHAIDSAVDSYHMGLGLGKSFSDGLISLYGGLNRFEDKQVMHCLKLKLEFLLILIQPFSIYL